jgi:hypothetical protein
MKNRTATTILISSATLLVSALAAESAMASTVKATILADNGSISVHQQGGTFKVIPSSVAGNWPKPQTFSVDIPDDPNSLKECKIHVIAWGDGGVAQGVMAHFAGNAGIAYTGKSGSPLNNVSMSSVKQPSGGIVAGQTFANNNANAKAIITGAAPANAAAFVSKPVIAGGITNTWGPIALPANMQERDGVKFIWNEKANNLNANPNNYRVLSMPCNTVVATKLTQAGTGIDTKLPEATPHVASWEIAGQFNAAQNPFEVWTYGYTEKADCTGPMIPFKNKLSTSLVDRPFDNWVRGTTTNANDLPAVAQSKGTTLLTPLKLSPNGISMHPGPQGQCAVVRFTAPAAGNYRFMGRFWGQNVSTGNNDVDVMVMVNNPSGLTTIASGNIRASGPVTNKPFMSPGVSLSVGSTIDFKVGSNGSFDSDSTGLHGYIQRDEP